MDPSEGAQRADDTASEKFSAQAGTLYVVATPLGNLRDVTLRALDVLGSVDAIAAEDTRVTSVLLRHYGILARPISLHQHNEAHRADEIVELLGRGRSVAVVSDAGTPGISDPGARVARLVRERGFPVVPIPGASAAIAAISAAGLDAESFLFLGFLPRATKARRELVGSIARLDVALVVYEAPHRVRDTVDDLREALGDGRRLVVAREITKKFETIASMPLGEAPAWLASDPNRERGEIVLIVDAPVETPAAKESTFVDAHKLLAALIAELPPSRAARVAAAVTGLPRDTLYARALALKGEAER